jgi:hypothetical protein
VVAKSLNLLLFVLIITAGCFTKKIKERKSIDPIYDIYNVCLDSFFLNSKLSKSEKLILNDSTFNFLGNSDKAIRGLIGDTATYELHVGFKDLNKTSVKIEKNNLKSSANIFYLSDINRTLNLTAQDNSFDFWKKLNTKHPMAKKIISFTKVSFSQNQKCALLDVNEISEESHSISRQVYLRREHDKYKIIYIK